MDDLISRQAAIDAIRQVTIHAEDESLAVEALEKLPSAQQWIPVTERLPKNDDWVIVTVLDESGDTLCLYTDFGWYLRAADCWVVGSEQRNDVITWMPLPAPWKGGES